MRQAQRIIYLMIFITISITLATTGNLFIQNEMISNFLNDFQYVGIFISLLTFFVQQLSDQRVKKTEFFISLKNTFIMDEIFMDVYNSLYQYYLNKNSDLSDLEQKHIVKYLAYFDSIALAVENKNIDIEEISKTFSYYFFIATNNPVVQQKELVAEGEHYLRIYELYKKLYDYNMKNGNEVLMKETALHLTNKYEKILRVVR